MKVIKKLLHYLLIVFKWILLELLGLRFIWRKIFTLSDEERKNVKNPATFGLWIIGLYIALFGIASQRYENSIDIIENRATAIYTQLSTPTYKKALSRIARVQNMRCPQKPYIINPINPSTWNLFPTTFKSLFGKDTLYMEMVKQLKETVEDWKDSLSGVNLNIAHLEDAKLIRAHLKGANLKKANLYGADLYEANLEGANLFEVNLKGAHLIGTNLKGTRLHIGNMEGATLIRAHLEGALLGGAYLKDANFRSAHLEGANLIMAHLDSAYLLEAHLDSTILEGAYLDSAILEEAYLEGVKGLTIDQLKTVKTLYKVEGLPPELLRQVKKQCPEKLATRYNSEEYEWYIDSTYLKEILADTSEGKEEW